MTSTTELDLNPVQPQALPGVLLKAARQAKGLTESDVATKLCLGINAIKSIELDDYSHMPAQTYARGYLLLYARLVGIPDEEILQAFTLVSSTVGSAEVHIAPVKQQSIPIYQPRGETQKPTVLFWISLLVFVTLIALVVMWWRGQRVDHSVDTNPAATTSTSMPIQAPAEDSSDNTPPSDGPPANNVSAKPDAQPSTPNNSPNNSPDNATPSAAPSATTPPPATTPAPTTTPPSTTAPATPTTPPPDNRGAASSNSSASASTAPAQPKKKKKKSSQDATLPAPKATDNAANLD